MNSSFLSQRTWRCCDKYTRVLGKTFSIWISHVLFTMILWDDESDLQVNGQVICFIYKSLIINNGRLVAEKNDTFRWWNPMCFNLHYCTSPVLSLCDFLLTSVAETTGWTLFSQVKVTSSALPSPSGVPLCFFWDFSHAILRDLILLSLSLLLQSPDSQLVFWCSELYLWMELALWLERQVFGYIQFLIILLHVFYILFYIPNLFKVSPMGKCHI